MTKRAHRIPPRAGLRSSDGVALPSPRQGPAGVAARLASVALFTLLTAFPPPTLLGQEPETDDRDLGRLIGEIRDESTGAPVAGVEAVLRTLKRRVVSNAAGRFVIGRMPPGTHELTLRHIAYGTRTVNVDIRPRATTKLNIFLPPAAIAVEPLEVRVERRIRPMYLERRGFYDREAAGLGLFWDPTDMERVASGLTGFDAERFFKVFGQWDPWRVARRRRCRAPAVYVNGRRDRTGLVESTMLSAFEVGAIEVYRDTQGVPGWALDPEAKCGVVVIWLRRW